MPKNTFQIQLSAEQLSTLEFVNSRRRGDESLADTLQAMAVHGLDNMSYRYKRNVLKAKELKESKQLIDQMQRRIAELEAAK